MPSAAGEWFGLAHKGGEMIKIVLAFFENLFIIEYT
jgi:hypothetical protein